MRRGFTLTETAVVIAIVIVVSAIVYPVFLGVRESAFKGKTVSNMRQLWTGIQIYRADWQALEFGSMEAMGLPDTPLWRHLGEDLRSIRPPSAPAGIEYYYYPIPEQIDRRQPSWASYTVAKGGQTVLLADVWFNPQSAAPFDRTIQDPSAWKLVIGITLEGNVRRKRAPGMLGMDWWDR